MINSNHNLKGHKKWIDLPKTFKLQIASLINCMNFDDRHKQFKQITIQYKVSNDKAGKLKSFCINSFEKWLCKHWEGKESINIDSNNNEELLDLCTYLPIFKNYLLKINFNSKREILDAMSVNNKIFCTLPMRYKLDKDILHMALRSNRGYLFKFAPKSILNSNLWFKLAVSKYIDTYPYFSKNVRENKKNKLFAFKRLHKIQNIQTFEKLPQNLQDQYIKDLNYADHNFLQKISPKCCLRIIKGSSTMLNYNSYWHSQLCHNSRWRNRGGAEGITKWIHSVIKSRCSKELIGKTLGYFLAESIKGTSIYIGDLGNFLANQMNMKQEFMEYHQPSIHTLSPFQIVLMRENINIDPEITDNMIKIFKSRFPSNPDAIPF
ncbi:hypothetical protein N9V00_00575 [Bacteroidota bacterium]|nr:hypothetical protein [Bacteroidota bacterium]